jgi:hypothetical protein
VKRCEYVETFTVGFVLRQRHQGRCQVRIDGAKIVVSYEQHDGPTVYEGEEIAPGHFKLTCARKSCRATLHRLPGENLLEGHWMAGQDQGMWRIQLKDE